MPEDEIRDVLSLLGLESIPLDEESAIRSGLLYPATHPSGLSLGDRACLTLAKNLNSTAVTADRTWQDLKAGVRVQLLHP